jgi:hypothetical protein
MGPSIRVSSKRASYQLQMRTPIKPLRFHSVRILVGVPFRDNRCLVNTAVTIRPPSQLRVVPVLVHTLASPHTCGSRQGSASFPTGRFSRWLSHEDPLQVLKSRTLVSVFVAAKRRTFWGSAWLCWPFPFVIREQIGCSKSLMAADWSLSFNSGCPHTSVCDTAVTLARSCALESCGEGLPAN